MRKRFYVKIDLQLHAITCPGVWLCVDSGWIDATVKTLGYFFRTDEMKPPRFPLLCHDRFSMEGFFTSVTSMSELERLLAAEQLEITLWQSGRRLANFVGNLSDVMQSRQRPKLSRGQHVDVQLQMKPSQAFPGNIAPKVELSIHVDVQDRLLPAAESWKSCNYLETKELTENSNFAQPTEKYHCDYQGSDLCCNSCLDGVGRQNPVCHAQDTRSNQHVDAQPSQDLSHKINGKRPSQISNQARLLSATSSNISYPSSHATGGISSGSRTSTNCCHSRDSRSMDVVDEHHQRCEICQTYQKVFQLPRSYGFS